MEFERSVYRVHERCLRSPSTKKCLNFLLTAFVFNVIINLLCLVLFHSMFVNDNSILKRNIEEQLKPYFYKELGRIHNVSFGANLDTFPTLSLNYTSDAKFVFDNTTETSMNNHKTLKVENTVTKANLTKH